MDTPATDRMAATVTAVSGPIHMGITVDRRHQVDRSMKIRAWTFQFALSVALIAVAGVGTGCGRITVLLGGGQPYGGYYYDDFYYDYGGYSYYDSYWYYDDYWYDYDDYYFVDYIDGWYYDWYDGCYYCKSGDVDITSMEEPASWDPRWGPWEKFVEARIDFLRADGARDTSHPKILPGR